ncbi:MAG: hypothetical protein N3D80_09960 [Ignavibacterium album]|uniref:hypothetical protein n=1 Tax=Ignavibacterium album TaxID=591197 RepID=UPI0026EE8EB0|nr:hypothetical protein [Ignavibacterium album]MCX8106179.1 hypothetical protein [Ignavibacterium album]
MKRVLIIEDNEETISNLESEFKNSGIDAVCCSDYENAEIAINNNIYNAVILDWYFVLPDSNQISIRILQQLKKSLFVPVFVYTGHLTDFENKTEEELQYPKNLIRGFGKESITPENLKKEIQSLIEKNLALKISMAYRSRIHHHLEKIFFELNDSENNALGNILKTIYGDGDNIDWNNDIILTLLHRSIISDDDFANEIKNILSPADRQENNQHNSQQNNQQFNRKIFNKILYHHGKSDYVRSCKPLAAII